MTPVEFHFLTPDGLPLANAEFEIQLSQSSFDDQVDGVLMPRLVVATTDADGKATISLQPSKLMYYVTLLDPLSDAALSYKFYVPTIELPTTYVRLQDIAVDSPISTTNYDEAAIQMIIGAKASSMSSQSVATGAAIAASQSETNAAASEVVAVAKADIATTAADNASTSAANALVSEHNAAQSATDAATTVTNAISDAVEAAKTAIINGAPAALDTLSELSASLNNDPSFANTMIVGLGNRVRVDIANQGLTAAQQANAKTNLSLDQVNNTSDVNKPVSAAQQTALDLKAPLASPALTGVPTAPTASAGTNNTQIASTAYADAAANKVKTDLVNGAGAALDTLNELASALGNDANYAATTSVALGNRLRVDTAAQGLTAAQQTNAKTNLALNNVDNTSDVNKPVSTAQAAALALKAPLASPSFTGNVGIGTPTPRSSLSFGAASFNTGIAGGNPSLRIYDDGANSVYGMGVNVDGGLEVSANQASQGIRFYAGTPNSAPTERVRIAGNGNVMIGTTYDNGIDKLQVSGSATITGGGSAALTVAGKSSANIAPDIQITRSSTLSPVGQGANIQFNDSGTVTNSRMIQAGAGNMQFLGYGGGGWAEHARFDISGNLGIGTTPMYKFHVDGGAATISAGGNASGAGGSLYLNAVSTSNAPMVGIKGVLDWCGGYEEQGSLAFLTRATTGVTGSPLAEKMRITAAGTVGIGTISPNSQFEIRRDDRTSGPIITLNNRSNVPSDPNNYIIGGLWAAALRDVRDPAYVAGIDFLRVAAAGGLSSSGNMVFYTAQDGGTAAETRTNERMRLDQYGNLLVGTSGATSITSDVLTLRRDQNAATQLVINNQSNGASAGARLSFCAYGGNWQINVPQSATYVNPLQFMWNGAETMRLDPSGNVGISGTPSAWNSIIKAVDIMGYGAYAASSTAAEMYANSYYSTGSAYTYKTAGAASLYQQAGGTHRWMNAPSGNAGATFAFTQAMTLDTSGNLLLGGTTSYGGRLYIDRAGTQGDFLAGFRGVYNCSSMDIYACGVSGASSAATAIAVQKNGGTGRSINTSGTVNASGADYAEYMTKTDTCGALAKGQIVGVSAEGKLTDQWSESVSFLIKSTDPSYVGGDVWGREESLGLTQPTDEASETYAADLEAFNTALEAARQKVDRMAYAGQVPVNVTGATPGQYIVPVQDGDGIKGIAVGEDDLTMKQYFKAVGIVQNILPDGRANVRVKVA